MRIRTFCKYLDVEEVKNHTLRDCTVVVDGQNFFYNLYEKSRLPSVYGCEGDKYAEYLRKFLEMFKKNNIRCVFLFKGGHTDINFKFKRLSERDWKTDWSDNHYFASPVFTKEIYKQILNEMNFEYAICEYESKAEIIAFAKKFKCKVISYDIEFCFSGVPYIPYTTISEENDGVKCGLFHLHDFYKKYNLNDEKLAIFIALTDENIFEENFFQALFDRLNMPKYPYKRNICLLKWLGRLSKQRALDVIYNYVASKNFDEKVLVAKKFIHRNESTGLPTKYIDNKKNMEFAELDPEWFEKGVTLGHISINYVNLYRNKIYFGAWTIEDENADDSLLFSLDIITYAYNLLTNYEGKEFVFHDKNNKKHVISHTRAGRGIFRKPDYVAVTSPFENGWDQVKNFRLFEHFLDESLQGFNHSAMRDCPEDVKLLIVALVYFSRKKAIDTTNIVCGMLLSYVMLGVVLNKLPDYDNQDIEIIKKPYLDASTQKDSVNEKDCVIANKILQKYFGMTKSESYEIFDRKIIHPYVEFQHCLVQINNLNILCGSSYKPTDYSKTFNGTFVYKVLLAAELDKGEAPEFIKKILNPAATVLSFFNGLFEVYQDIMFH
ncbi:uncharacterized protein LOC106137676 [Amyelois transitella]|uniref:uncharacterized protein LOC106137676 n=1 Tax=Amyelois transitella TaxID=680683 RepID=UPI00067A92A8|nr:uncharacterized protein LOC106137676 [Amyelois transitella]